MPNAGRHRHTRNAARFALALFAFVVATGTVHAAPVQQAAPATYDAVNAIVAVGGIGLGVLAIVAFIVSRLPNSKNSNDVLSESLRLERERFEQQKNDESERIRLEERRINEQVAVNEKQNQNVAALIEQMALEREATEKLRQIMHQDRTAVMTNLKEDTEAKRLLAESISAMTAEDERKNLETERRLLGIERTMEAMKADLASIKKSLGPDASGKISRIENDLANLFAEMHKLVDSLKTNQTETQPHETPPAVPPSAVPAVSIDGVDGAKSALDEHASAPSRADGSSV